MTRFWRYGQAKRAYVYDLQFSGIILLTHSPTQAIVNEFDPPVRYFDDALSTHSLTLFQKTAESKNGNNKQD